MSPETPPPEIKPITAAETERVRQATVGAKKIVIAIHGIGSPPRTGRRAQLYEKFGPIEAISPFAQFPWIPAVT